MRPWHNSGSCTLCEHKLHLHHIEHRLRDTAMLHCSCSMVIQSCLLLAFSVRLPPNSQLSTCLYPKFRRPISIHRMAPRMELSLI